MFYLGMAMVAVLPAPAHGQNANEAARLDDSLKIYAVHTVKTRLFQRVEGVGVYLGRGAVLTASHVVGNWPMLTNPRVLIAGQELPAQIVKQDSLEETDLALLSVDESKLPISLRLRRNPVCKTAMRIGEAVVVVTPGQVVRSRILSPMLIPTQYRARFGTVIADVAHAVSGSGVFDAGKHCLLGIVSRKILVGMAPQANQPNNKPIAGFAKYFVPPRTITKFLPDEFRF
jgi:hypothetical protein